MTNLEFMANLSWAIGYLSSPVDMQRGEIIANLRTAVENRALGHGKLSEVALDRASELIKAMIQEKREAGF